LTTEDTNKLQIDIAEIKTTLTQVLVTLEDIKAGKTPNCERHEQQIQQTQRDITDLCGGRTQWQEAREQRIHSLELQARGMWATVSAIVVTLITATILNVIK